VRKHLPVVAVIAAALLLPLFLQQAFYKHILIMSAINIILAVSLGIVVGYLGELSLAHAAFYGIGAYTSALLAMKLQVPFIPAFFLAIFAAGIMGYLIGIPALRLSGHYFAIATLGFQGIVILLIVNLVDITRGPMGLPGIPPPDTINMFGILISFRDKLSYYYLTLLVLLIILFITRNLIRYKFGQAFLSTREDPALAASVGVRPKKFRLLAFVISTSMAGAAGSLYAHYALFISPDSFHLSESIYFATMVIIGGRGTIMGPILGAMLLTVLPEVLRFAGELQFVLYGLMLMIVVVFMPRGLIGIFYKSTGKGYQLSPNGGKSADGVTDR
jgi:branched-chain amino acid transport system permease protein